jgi:gliding motility-associated protein GldM
MAGGKQTPRQRMINILYLVLLGLIALNVPDNLLDAFKKITDSLTNSSKNVQSGITTTFTTFEKTSLKEQHERALPWYNKAVQAREYADKLNDDVEKIKQDLITNTGGIDPKTEDYKGRDNMDVSFNRLIANSKATELKKEIVETRQKLLGLLDPKDQTGVDLSLSADDPKNPKEGKNTWELANFAEGIPMGAVITTLTKIQSDTKNSESEVVKKLLSKVDQAVVNLDQFNAVAVAPSSYVLVGQPYTAQVFLTASDSHSKPDITVGGSQLPIENGQGKYVGSTSSEGIKTWVGTIRVKQTDGTIKTYNTPTQTYQVAKPSAVVSPDKMNVLYIGVENPLSVSAPGIPADKMHVSISSGSLSQSSPGHYAAKVSTIGDAKVTISAELEKGKSQVMGTTLFRVKRIPDPIARFAGKSSGSTPAVNIRSQDRVFAILDNFEFDAKFTVTRFTLFIQKPRQDFIIKKGTGNELNAEMKAAMSTVTPGTKVIFDDITAVGPDGGIRGLQPIILTAN